MSAEQGLRGRTGRTGRLYKGLVDGRKIANQVSASVDGRKYDGIFMVEATVKDGEDPAAVEAATGTTESFDLPGREDLRLPAPLFSVAVGADFVVALPTTRVAVMGPAGVEYVYKDELRKIRGAVPARLKARARLC